LKLKTKSLKAKVTNIKTTTASSKEGSYDKMYITFNLLHTLPVVNSKGSTFEPEPTQKAVDTVVDGYLNIEHLQGFNVGSVVEAEYKTNDNDVGYIECLGVVWKSSLKEYQVNPQEILDGKFGISMEVAYTDFYFLHGDEKKLADGNEHLENYIGEEFEDEEVVEVIKPLELKGGALTETPADKGAVIKEVRAKVANLDKDDDGDNDDNTLKGGNQDMFKEFETEEEYNQHLEDVRQGYAKVEDILSKFPEDLQGDDVEDVVEEVAGLKSDLKETQASFEEYKKEVLFKERKASLEEVDIEVVEEDKEEIINMSEATFDMLVESNKDKLDQVNESNASTNDDSDEGKLDANIQQSFSNEDVDVDTAVDSL
jgi:hypothetical protein